MLNHLKQDQLIDIKTENGGSRIRLLNYEVSEEKVKERRAVTAAEALEEYIRDLDNGIPRY